MENSGVGNVEGRNDGTILGSEVGDTEGTIVGLWLGLGLVVEG